LTLYGSLLRTLASLVFFPRKMTDPHLFTSRPGNHRYHRAAISATAELISLWQKLEP